MTDLRKDNLTRDRLDKMEKDFHDRSVHNQELIREVGDAYKAFARKTSALLLLIAVVLFVSGYINYYLLNQNNERANEIQSQRYTSVITSCTAQNSRHDKTIAELHVLISRIKDQVQKRQAQQNISGTIAFVNALVPHQNCKAVALRVVHPPHKAPE